MGARGAEPPTSESTGDLLGDYVAMKFTGGGAEAGDAAQAKDGKDSGEVCSRDRGPDAAQEPGGAAPAANGSRPHPEAGESQQAGAGAARAAPEHNTSGSNHPPPPDVSGGAGEDGACPSGQPSQSGECTPKPPRKRPRGSPASSARAGPSSAARACPPDSPQVALRSTRRRSRSGEQDVIDVRDRQREPIDATGDADDDDEAGQIARGAPEEPATAAAAAPPAPPPAAAAAAAAPAADAAQPDTEVEVVEVNAHGAPPPDVAAAGGAGPPEAGPLPEQYKHLLGVQIVASGDQEDNLGHIRKMLRTQRYHDAEVVNFKAADHKPPAAQFMTRCFRCGLPGHMARECRNTVPKRPCERCAEFGHSFDNCPKSLCFKCGGFGHLVRDCPNEPMDSRRMVCVVCGSAGCDASHQGDWVRAARGCSKGYSKEDLKNVRCFVCGEFGHLCCSDGDSEQSTQPPRGGCCLCGEPGHTGLLNDCPNGLPPHLSAEQNADRRRWHQMRLQQESDWRRETERQSGGRSSGGRSGHSDRDRDRGRERGGPDPRYSHPAEALRAAQPYGGGHRQQQQQHPHHLSAPPGAHHGRVYATMSPPMSQSAPRVVAAWEQPARGRDDIREHARLRSSHSVDAGALGGRRGVPNPNWEAHQQVVQGQARVQSAPVGVDLRQEAVPRGYGPQRYGVTPQKRGRWGYEAGDSREWQQQAARPQPQQQQVWQGQVQQGQYQRAWQGQVQHVQAHQVQQVQMQHMQHMQVQQGQWNNAPQQGQTWVLQTQQNMPMHQGSSGYVLQPLPADAPPVVHRAAQVNAVQGAHARSGQQGAGWARQQSRRN